MREMNVNGIGVYGIRVFVGEPGAFGSESAFFPDDGRGDIRDNVRRYMLRKGGARFASCRYADGRATIRMTYDWDAEPHTPGYQAVVPHPYLKDGSILIYGGEGYAL